MNSEKTGGETCKGARAPLWIAGLGLSQVFFKVYRHRWGPRPNWPLIWWRGAAAGTACALRGASCPSTASPPPSPPQPSVPPPGQGPGGTQCGRKSAVDHPSSGRQITYCFCLCRFQPQPLLPLPTDTAYDSCLRFPIPAGSQPAALPWPRDPSPASGRICRGTYMQPSQLTIPTNQPFGPQKTGILRGRSSRPRSPSLISLHQPPPSGGRLPAARG